MVAPSFVVAQGVAAVAHMVVLRAAPLEVWRGQNFPASWGTVLVRGCVFGVDVGVGALDAANILATCLMASMV